MKYYCDTEFTSFEGELMSIALVPDDETKSALYLEVEYDKNKVHPWVMVNVVPHLSGNPVSRVEAAKTIRDYFTRHSYPAERVEVIADWPEDLAHFFNLLIVGPGTMIGVNDIHARLLRTKGAVSEIPHHALYDAIAMRNFWSGE